MNFLFSNKYLFIFSGIFLTIFPVFSLAYTAIAPISNVETTSPADYISSLYTWGISIVGILALLRLVQGGVMYMVSGAVDKKNEAKGIITDALVGVLLALSSALILNIINPQIVTIQNPKLEMTFCSKAGDIPDSVGSLENKDYTCGSTTPYNDNCETFWTCCPPGTTLSSTSIQTSTGYFTCK